MNSRLGLRRSILRSLSLAPLAALVAVAACGRSSEFDSSNHPSSPMPPTQPAAVAPEPATTSASPSETGLATRDELGTGREVEPLAPAKPAPDLARERRLAERERELAARESRLRERERSATAPEPSPEPASGPIGANDAVESAGSAEPAESTEPAEPAEPASGLADEVSPEPARSLEPTVAAELPHAAPATVPAGTSFSVELVGDLSSSTSRTGDLFRARIARDVRVDGRVSIPAGAEIQGLVAEAVSARKGRRGQALLRLEVTDLVLPTGETVPISARLEQIGKGDAGRDAATVGGGAAAGAILGRVLGGSDKGKGTLIGAIVGAIAGAAVAAHTGGEEVVLPAGTPIEIRLDRGLEIGGER